MSKLGFFLSKKVGKAICDFKMLEDGDRVAVAVSGGKDSLALLKILEERRRIVPIRYKVVALHVDMGYGRSKAKDLAKYCKDNGYEYHSKNISISKDIKRGKVNCFWCSWNRRKHLFELAHKHKCRKLALGHHMDDIVHTLLLNLFFQADFGSMAPVQDFFGGKIYIIRPLVYVQEQELRRFTKELDFEVTSCSCPDADNNKRALMRKIVSKVEKVCFNAKINLFRSLYKDERFLKGYRDKAKRKKI